MASTKQINQFEIYWAKFDPAVGSEIQKTRPCVVVSPNIMNSLLNTVMVVPLIKTLIDWPFRLNLRVQGNDSSAACDQLRSVSTERLGDKIAILDPVEGEKILKTLQAIFDRP